MRITMQCHPSLCYVMYLGTFLFAVQFNAFVSLLWFLFIAYYRFLVMQQKTNSYLVEIPVERSIFGCNIQKSVPRSLQLKSIILSSRIEICSWDLKLQCIYQRLVNNGGPVTRVELKIFTRFVFKLVFRVTGRSVPCNKHLTSKRTGVHNLHVIFKCCL